jgi:hypothetical protein
VTAIDKAGNTYSAATPYAGYLTELWQGIVLAAVALLALFYSLRNLAKRN